MSFTRLADGEEMPAREKVRPGRRLGYRWVALLLGLAMTVGLITVGLVFSRGGGGPCTGSWATVCTNPAPAHGSHPAVHDQGAGLVPVG